MSASRVHSWSPGFAVLCASVVAAGWVAGDDVGFRDSGELGAAAFGLGVAHPTGFAVDMLLLRAASFVPLGHLAFRHNALIALQAAACLALLVQISTQLSAQLGVRAARTQAVSAVLGVGVLTGWLTFAQSAVTTEVYTLALLSLALAGYGLVAGGEKRGLLACVLGLAPGLHVTAGLYAAVLLVGLGLLVGARAWVGFLRARAAVIAACGLCVLYLPLASRRQPAIDWGNPETLSAMWAHLTAARIRASFGASMFAAAPDSQGTLAGQMLELWPAWLLATAGLLLGVARVRALSQASSAQDAEQPQRARLALLALLALLVLDLAYAAWVHPMGAQERQVGHVACACLAVLASVGAALVGDVWRRPALRAVWAGGVLVLAFVLAARLPRAELARGYAASELLGSGGTLAAVPARSIVVCSSDDACAAGWFAQLVEAVRPDVALVPAQHLWDPGIRRQLEGTSLQHAREPMPERRAQVAAAVVRQLALGGEPRPVLFGAIEPLQRVGLQAEARASSVPPFLAVAPANDPARDPLAHFDRVRAARFSRADRYAALAWARAYDALGAGLLANEPRQAVRAFRTGVELAPERAVGWVNLGVAFERAGNLTGAEHSAARAIELAPERPTAWVNLARLRLQTQGKPAAREVLELAARAGVRDARLDALREQLSR